jgi:hypothetical protein
VEFNFHVPFQSGEGAWQPNVAANAQNTTQPRHAFLIDFVLGSVQKSANFEQGVPDETNTKEKVHCNFQPIPFRFFGAIDPTVKADPRFPDVRIDHRQEKEERPEDKQSIRPP